MSLPYYCHHCNSTSLPAPEMYCSLCGSDFIEIFDPTEHSNIDSLTLIEELITQIREPSVPFISLFRQRFRDALNTHGAHINDLRCNADIISDTSSIASDRRNYVLGPELDYIIQRLLEEEGTKNYNPVSQAFIDNIKSGKCKVQGECSICLNNIKKGSECIGFICKHSFHAECAIAWMKIQNTCPNCRKKLE